MTALTDQQIATRSAEAMWKNDDASQSLGISFPQVEPGCATATLTVEQRHTNGHGICHGGYIFTLADTAFAFACNSYNQVAVAQQNSISFVAPAKLGDTLTATATEVHRAARSAIYDALVLNQYGDKIAIFRGNSRTLNKTLFER